MLMAAAIFVVAAILAGQAMARPGACERPMASVGMRGTGVTGDQGVHSIAVTTKFVAIFIFKADLDASARPILIAVSRATVHILIITLHPPIAACSAVVHIFHHASHMLLTHAVHARAILIALCCPVSLDAGVFSALTLSLPRLIGLLRRTVRLNRGGLGLGGAGWSFGLLSKGEAGDEERGEEQNGRCC
jgi:hypothetical protein